MKSIVYQYVTDSQENRLAVQISLEEWELLQKEIAELKRKLEILQGIREALLEVREARRTGRKLQTLKDFLNEC